MPIYTMSVKIIPLYSEYDGNVKFERILSKLRALNFELFCENVNNSLKYCLIVTLSGFTFVLYIV